MHWSVWVVVGLVVYVLAYAAVAWFVPAVLRPVWWVAARVLHKFHVYHADRIPRSGPVLIACNHVSYLDWLFVWAACPRPLTMVLWAKYKRNPVLRFFLSFARHRLIFLDRTTAPHALAAELDQVSAALRQDKCVLVFPEGRLTRNGQMMPFRRGIERVARRAGKPVAIVPACLWNVWGTLLTHKGRMFWRWPEGFRRRIAVHFGQPLPGTTSAAEVRAAVVECWADAAISQSEYNIPVHANFVRNAARLGNLRKPAFIDAATSPDRVLTWPKALVGAWGLAGWLKPRLAADEKCVGVWLPTGLGSAFANIALAFLHRTSVNLNYTAGPDAVHSAARQAGLKTVITAKRFTARIPLDLPPDITVINLEDALAGISSLAKLWRLLAVILLPGWLLERVVLRCRRFKWDDLLTIVFSSGSTGEPKGVMLSLRNISSNADSFQKGVNFTTQDRMLCTLPFFHSFGYTVCLWAPASIGMTSVFYPDPRAAKEVGELAERTKCTIALGTATFVRFYVRRCEPTHFRSVRLFICGAEKLPVPLQLEFQEKFGTLLLEGYGCTEVSPVVGTNLPDVTVKGHTQTANTQGTIGQPLPGVAVKAFDPETGQPLPLGAEGVLGVKGPNVMVGYLHQPEKTKQVMFGEWYNTGDVGHVEPAGFIRITGRLSRFAKIAGEMVPLERLEEEIHAVLGLAGDRAVAVAAVPDSKRGERLVVLHLAEWGAKLKGAFDALRTRGLPNLWVPDVRDCFPVEAFPALGSGKLDLRGLTDLAKRLSPAG